jgi:hypothetical protein
MAPLSLAPVSLEALTSSQIDATTDEEREEIDAA